MISISLFPLGYIDPGTGSLLLTTLLGIGMTILFSLKGLFYRLRHRLTGRRGKQPVLNCRGELVFYSEGGKYWPVFQPVIEQLLQQGEKLFYFTSDRADPGLDYHHEHLTAVYLGSIRYSIICLNRLEADSVVMTTPQLGVMMLKRSRKVKRYIHLMHAPTDIHTYEKFAFDDFDAVLCSGPFQIKHIRELERLRHTQEKLLFKTGCTYYDLQEERAHHAAEKTILVAPTWGEKSFLKRCGEALLRQLLEDGWQVIFRPHPQSFISDRELINRLFAAFGMHGSFELDRSISNRQAMARANCLITDISGIIYDFAFLYRKPVLAFDIAWDKGGFEAGDLADEQAEYALLRDVGQLITADDIGRISEIIDKVREVRVDRQLIARYIFNFRQSAPVAARQIMRLHRPDGNAWAGDERAESDGGKQREKH